MADTRIPFSPQYGGFTSKPTGSSGGSQGIAEKFGVDPEFSEFEKQYASKQNVEREEVIYSDKEVTLIKNPKSLENIGSNVRGIVGKNGNLFVEQEVSIVHDEILNRPEIDKFVVDGDSVEVLQRIHIS